MKKLLLTAVIFTLCSGFAMAEFVYNVGLGYQMFVYSDVSNGNSAVLPYGVSIDGSLGGSFGEENKYSTGLRLSSGLAISSLSGLIWNFFQAGLYFGYRAADKLYLIPFAGLNGAGDFVGIAGCAGSLGLQDIFTPVLGMRVEFSSIYLDFAYRYSPNARLGFFNFGVGFSYRKHVKDKRYNF